MAPAFPRSSSTKWYLPDQESSARIRGLDLETSAQLLSPSPHVAESVSTSSTLSLIDAATIVEHLKPTHIGVNGEDHTGSGGLGVTAHVRECLSKGRQQVFDDLVGEGCIDGTVDRV